MAAIITAETWKATRTAVKEAGDRFADLVASAPDPHAEATAGRSVADIAAHVAFITWMDAVLVRFDDVPLPIPVAADHILTTTVDTVHQFNDVALRHFPERDPQVLAQRVRTDIDQILRAVDGLDPAKPVTWLGDSQVPLAGLLAHLVNELLIHGRDIARVTRSHWAMPPQDAALFFELLVVGVLRNEVGRLLDSDEPPRDRRIAVEFRSRYTSPVILVLHKGKVTIDEQGRAVDAHVFYDPATLNLMLFGRISKPRAALTGKLVVWGRRPWLLPAFLRVVRVPS